MSDSYLLGNGKILCVCRLAGHSATARLRDAREGVDVSGLALYLFQRMVVRSVFVLVSEGSPNGSGGCSDIQGIPENVPFAHPRRDMDGRTSVHGPIAGVD